MKFNRLTPRYPTTDIPALIDFYTNRLEFEVCVLWPSPEAPQFCAMERDGTRIGFYFDEAATEHPLRMEVRIEMEGVLDMHASLSCIMEVAWGPEVYSFGCREFAVLDPDGRMLIFSEPTDDPPTVDV